MQNLRAVLIIAMASLATLLVVTATWPQRLITTGENESLLAPAPAEGEQVPGQRQASDGSGPGPPRLNPAGRRWQNLLRLHDLDGDGLISRSEWRGRLQAFRRMDLNGDGLLDIEEGQWAAENLFGRGVSLVG